MVSSCECLRYSSFSSEYFRRFHPSETSAGAQRTVPHVCLHVVRNLCSPGRVLFVLRGVILKRRHLRVINRGVTLSLRLPQMVLHYRIDFLSMFKVIHLVRMCSKGRGLLKGLHARVLVLHGTRVRRILEIQRNPRCPQPKWKMGRSRQENDWILSGIWTSQTLYIGIIEDAMWKNIHPIDG